MSIIGSLNIPASTLARASANLKRDEMLQSQKSDAFNNGAQGQAYQPGEGYFATERAINKIIEIITGLKDDGSAPSGQPQVEESGGAILSAEGTDGDDTMTFKSAMLFSLNAGSGKDNVTIKSASASSIDLGSDDDQLRLASLYLGDIAGGDGNDTIEATGKLAMGIDGGNGNDTITVKARAILDVTGGEGNDSIRLSGERIEASGGKGDDTFALDNRDGLSTLSFSRGDGKDTINANGRLDIRFDGPDAYQPDDLNISISGGNLLIKSKDGSDTITISQKNGGQYGDASAWSFSNQDGQWVLSVN